MYSHFSPLPPVPHGPETIQILCFTLPTLSEFTWNLSSIFAYPVIFRDRSEEKDTTVGSELTSDSILESYNMNLMFPQHHLEGLTGKFYNDAHRWP